MYAYFLKNVTNSRGRVSASEESHVVFQIDPSTIATASKRRSYCPTATLYSTHIHTYI